MKKQVIYVIPQLYCFGEPICQMFYLKNIFCNDDKFNITVITYPLQKLRVNKHVFNVIMRGVNVIHTTDNQLIWFSTDAEKSSSFIEDDNNIYVIAERLELEKEFCIKYEGKERVSKYFSLSEIDILEGYRLRKELGIPRNAPIVTLLVRTRGWSKQPYEQVDYRNADIENYMPAINYLIQNGFYVVRIGDKTMKPVSNPPAKFIELPFHNSYTQFAEAYFIASSTFYMGTPSGPYSLAEGFNIPFLSTDSFIYPHVRVWKNDIHMFKRFYSHAYKRLLTYEEVLKSAIINFSKDSDFIKAGIDVISNSPEEILSAVKEMLQRLNGTYTSNHEMSKISEQLQKIQTKALNFQKRRYPDFPYMGIYHIAHSDFVPVSIEWLKTNPDLLY